MDAAQALADLAEVSSQIQAAVLADLDGAVLASTLSEGAGAGLATAARKLLEAAEPLDGERAAPLVQLEASTVEGCVFVVRDTERLIAATTSAEPTVGLVFYDLKSCLRAAAAQEKPKPKARRKQGEESGDAEAL